MCLIRDHSRSKHAPTGIKLSLAGNRKSILHIKVFNENIFLRLKAIGINCATRVQKIAMGYDPLDKLITRNYGCALIEEIKN